MYLLKNIKKANSDNENSIKITSKKIYVPHNRLPALHKIKTNNFKRPLIETGNEKVSHLLKTYIQRQKQKTFNRSFDSENKEDNQEIPLNKHLIEEFFATKTLMPLALKTEVSPMIIRNKSSDSEAIKTKNQENIENNLILNNKKEENFTIPSPVLTCLNIKRLVANLKKFNTPILKKTPDKNNRKIDENIGNMVKTEENTNNTKGGKIPRNHKKHSFLENMKKNFEISPYQRYELFIRSMNFTNNFTVNLSKNFLCFKAYIGKGNNKSLIKTLIKNRFF